jgi:hypothetical protein
MLVWTCVQPLEMECVEGGRGFTLFLFGWSEEVPESRLILVDDGGINRDRGSIRSVFGISCC